MNNAVSSHQPIVTAFDTSSSDVRPRVSLEQLCSDIAKYLEPYETVLTIKQLYDVERRLCNQHSVKQFAEFALEDDQHQPMDFITVLYQCRNQIDPKGKLSVYENVASSSERQEMYTFVNQLSIFHDQREGENQRQFDETKREIHYTKDQNSAVEKAVKHKFGGLLGFSQTSQVLNRAKQHRRQLNNPIQ